MSVVGSPNDSRACFSAIKSDKVFFSFLFFSSVVSRIVATIVVPVISTDAPGGRCSVTLYVFVPSSKSGASIAVPVIVQFFTVINILAMHK